MPNMIKELVDLSIHGRYFRYLGILLAAAYLTRLYLIGLYGDPSNDNPVF
jgi:hypothetical protein